jgi:hypothetical protein
MHVCSAPVENRRGLWLAATVYFVKGETLANEGGWRKGKPGRAWNGKASQFNRGFHPWHG